MPNTLIEYELARNNIVLIDFSDMVNMIIRGDAAADFLNIVCTGDVGGLSDGHILNTALCHDNGAIVAIVWILKDENCFHLHSDSAKKSELLGWIDYCLDRHKEMRVSVENVASIMACFSLIGPKAIEVPITLIDEDIIGLQYLAFNHYFFGNIECQICRYGYTGEYEYRIIFPNEFKDEVKREILDSGKEFNIQECGKEVLDVLYLEMKSINQNRDIRDDTTPLEAGLHWMLNLRKNGFIGKDALEIIKKENTYNKLVMVISESAEGIKEFGKVMIMGKKEIGTIIHREYSPMLEKYIALASLDHHYGYSGLDVFVEGLSGDLFPAKTASAPLFATQTGAIARER